MYVYFVGVSCMYTLWACFIQDSFPAPCGPESLYSTLSEKDLTDDISNFKYFALNNMTILGVLEKDKMSSHKQGTQSKYTLVTQASHTG